MKTKAREILVFTLGLIAFVVIAYCFVLAIGAELLTLELFQ